MILERRDRAAEAMEPARDRKRWMVCALLFAATTVNYVDRQVIGLLKPVLETELGWNELDYSTIVVWFQASYAAGLLLAGRVLDQVGVKRGYAAAVSFWSLATVGQPSPVRWPDSRWHAGCWALQRPGTSLPR